MYAAVGVNPRATATTSNASESAPPEQATTTGPSMAWSPMARALSCATSGSAGTDTREPGVRAGELVHRRQAFGTAPRRIERARAALAFDGRDERLPDLVLAHLRLDTDQLLEQLLRPGCAAPRLQHSRHALLSLDVTLSELVHHAIAVAFEQRHQRLHSGERRSVLLRSQQANEAALVERIASATELVDGSYQRLDNLTRLGIDHGERLLHEAKKVVLHPRDAGELRAVRYLVDRNPQAEVARPEREPLLETEDVGADVVDGVGHVPVVIRHQQVVLAEDALGEPPEQQSQLRGGDAAPDGRERALRHAWRDAIGEGLQQ